jgi:hypothetical protein
LLKIRLKLLQVKTEILSYEKIVEVLQEEPDITKIPSNNETSVQENSADECFKAHLPEGGWTTSGCNNCSSNSDLIQLFATTSNRHDVLCNLEEGECSGSTFKDGKFQMSNNCSYVKGIRQQEGLRQMIA